MQAASVAATGFANTQAVAYSTANLSSGTKLIAVIGCDNSGTADVISSVTFGAGNNGTQCGFLNSTTDLVDVALYAMDTPAGVVGTKPTVTVTFNAGQTPACSLVILEVSGLATGNTTAAMLDGTAATAAFAAAASDAQPSYSSTAANEFLVVCEADNGGPQTVTQPGGYTLNGSSVTNNGNANAAIAYKNSTGGAESGTWTFGGTTTGTALLVVAFKIPAGAAPPLPVSTAVYRPAPAPVQIPPRVTFAEAVAVTAGLATGTGAALQPAVAISEGTLVTTALYRPPPAPVQIPPQAIYSAPVTPGQASAQLATGTGAALSPSVAIAEGTLVTQAPYRPPVPPVQIPPQVVYGEAVTAKAGLATGTGAALQPSVATNVASGLPPTAASLLAYAPPVQIPPQVITGPPAAVPGQANAGLATGTGAALQPAVAIAANAGLATGTGAALGPVPSEGANAGLATGTGTAQAPVPAVAANVTVATGTGAALAPAAGYGTGLATGTGAALTASLAIAANAAAATALGAALNATGQAVQPFTVGALTATSAPGAASGGVLTATDQRAGGPS